MRRNLIDPCLKEMTYEIRNIVKVAKEIEKKGVTISWENIGDPVRKGEKIPDWIKEKVTDLIKEDSNWAYAPSKGIEQTRKYLADLTNMRGGTFINQEDILFFNGLGDAIGKIYEFLDKDSRVIGPSPAYPTHSSAEAAHAKQEHITYNLDPNNGWLPDVEDLKNKIKENENITGILIINPNNPTGTTYTKETMQEIVNIAKENNLFIISDEIYLNLSYEKNATLLGDVIGDVCGISMKGISKEIPWPGARCGWIEAYNTDNDKEFKKYFRTLEDAKMMEVCSTTLPQTAIMPILSDERYQTHVAQRKQNFKERCEIAYDTLKDVEGIKIIKPTGAFYMTVMFEDGRLNDNQKLNIENEEVRKYVEEIIKDKDLDARFVYYLLGSTGICIVPLTGFCCNKKGFRITLLETDKEKLKWVFETIREKIKEYLNS